MFDIVGKRRWFFLFSIIVTIPGLIFLLLTPITNGQAGLKFSIDYTGGTEWSIRFADPTVTSEQVREALAELGQEDITVTHTGRNFFDIRLSGLDLIEAPTPWASPSAAASGSPGATGGASALPAASASPGPSASAPPTATPAPSAATASPGPSASPIPGQANTVPTTGELGEIATGLQERLGPIAEQAKLSSIGAVVSADLVSQAILLIFVGSLGILAWITIRFRDVKMGVTALVALLHDVIVVLGFFAVLGTFLDVKIDGLFVTAMLTVIGFSVHDTSWSSTASGRTGHGTSASRSRRS